MASAAPARAERTPAPARGGARAPAAKGPTTAATGPGLDRAPPAVTIAAKVAPNEVDLSTGQLAVPNAEQVKEGDRVDVPVRLPRLAEGVVTVVKRDGVFDTPGAGSAILLVHPVLARLAQPTVLVVSVNAGAIGGYVTLGIPGPAKGKDRALFGAIQKGVDALGWLGLSNLQLPNVTNDFTNGKLSLGVDGMKFRVGGFLEGSGSFHLEGVDLTLEGSATISIPGGSQGTLVIKRDPKGTLSGSVDVAVTLGGLSGSVKGELVDGFVRVMGTVGYTSDKLSGSVTLVATDEATARDLTLKKPTEGELPKLDEEAQKSAKPGRRAFCGWGQLSFQITDWLAGTATVIVNSKGQATIIGEIAPPKEFILFEQKTWEKRLFRVEIRAAYGIPVVGNVFVFANIGLAALATVGPGKLYAIKLAGTYSTDPRVPKQLSIQATLNISAFAGLRLRAEGGVGIEILSHDIKAGVGLDALAGVRGYVEATPIIGLRQVGKKNEYYIAGHMEIAAQPFLGFSGDLFVAIETPWWSPLSDKKWTWPLFSLEYPLPGEFGIGADVDYVLGSKKWPEITFGEVDFDSSKFMSDLLDDEVPKGSHGEQRKPGTWDEGGGKGGAKSGTGKGGGGKGPKEKGGKGITGPIGEPVSFSDGAETHRLYVEEKPGSARPMVASTPEEPAKVIERCERDIPDAMTGDQAKARAAAARAKALVAPLTTETGDAAVKKKAASDPKKAEQEAKENKKKKKAAGDKGDTDKLLAKVKSDEHALSQALGELEALTRRVPWKPIKKPSQMDGGTEPVEVVEKSAAAHLKVAKKDGADQLTGVAAGPVGTAVNKRGNLLVTGAATKVAVAATTVAKTKIRDKKVNAKAYPLLEESAGRVAEDVGHVGKTMKIPTLARALREEWMKKKVPFEFEAKPKTPDKHTNLYKNRFLAEMKRQLAMQEKGLGRLSVDKWLVNLLMFSMNAKIFRELDHEGRKEVLAKLNERAEKAAQRTTRWLEQVERSIEAKKKDSDSREKTLKELKKDLDRAEGRVAQVERALESIERAQRAAATGDVRTPRRETLAPFDPRTIDDEYPRRERLRIIGRMEQERAAREKVEADLDELRKSVPGWRTLAKTASDLAILHNPDQVAGGYDVWTDMPDPPGKDDQKSWDAYIKKLRKFFGPKVVNERIGTQWKGQMDKAVTEVKAAVPQESYAINLLNFKLTALT